jgi:hypothetical protein
MTLPIASITALFAGLLILLLTLKVVQLRRRDGVVLGDNDNRRLAKAIRGHANAVEQVPNSIDRDGAVRGTGRRAAPACRAGHPLDRGADHACCLFRDPRHPLANARIWHVANHDRAGCTAPSPSSGNSYVIRPRKAAQCQSFASQILLLNVLISQTPRLAATKHGYKVMLVD